MSKQDCKVFIGGLSWETTGDKLRQYFENFGTVKEAFVSYNRNNGRPRGFGFVVFECPEIADKVVAAKHTIDRREVEAKRAVAKEEYGIPKPVAGPVSQKTRKIFVGGLAPSVDEKVLQHYFEQFGPVEDAVVMYDHDNKRPRGFGFVTFTQEEPVEKVFEKGAMQTLLDKQIEIKSAVPRDQMQGSVARAAYTQSPPPQFAIPARPPVSTASNQMQIPNVRPMPRGPMPAPMSAPMKLGIKGPTALEKGPMPTGAQHPGQPTAPQIPRPQLPLYGTGMPLSNAGSVPQSTTGFDMFATNYGLRNSAPDMLANSHTLYHLAAAAFPHPRHHVSGTMQSSSATSEKQLNVFADGLNLKSFGGLPGSFVGGYQPFAPQGGGDGRYRAQQDAEFPRDGVSLGLPEFTAFPEGGFANVPAPGWSS